MFEKFSFKQATVPDGSPTASTANSTAVSPTSTRSSSPILRQSGNSSTSILELSRQFSEHSIDQYLRCTSVQEPPRQTSAESSISHNYDSNPSSSRSSTSSFSSSLSSNTLYSDSSPTAIRLQRQAHTRMQAENSHLRDISTLVQKMISNGDQCMVCTNPSEESSVATTIAPQSITATDDGSSYASDAEISDDKTRRLPGRGHKRATSAVLPYAVKHRKAGDMGNTYVSKTMRVRKQIPDRVTYRSR